MTRRIVTAGSPLQYRYSLPGFDAVTGSDDQMAFDPLFGIGYAGTYLGGTVPWSSFSLVDSFSGSFYRYEATLSFGKTFVNPPIVWWMPVKSGTVRTRSLDAQSTYRKTGNSAVIFGIVFGAAGAVATDAAYRVMQR